jgi:hypothetical protein
MGQYKKALTWPIKLADFSCCASRLRDLGPGSEIAAPMGSRRIFLRGY